MTDDELQQRLRRWARPGAEPDWDSMAAGVRAAFEAETQRSEAGPTTLEAARRRPRRRRWMAAPLAGALALAAAMTLYVRVHHTPRMSPLEDEAVMMDDADPDELIDELTPAQLDRVAQALKKGA